MRSWSACCPTMSCLRIICMKLAPRSKPTWQDLRVSLVILNTFVSPQASMLFQRWARSALFQELLAEQLPDRVPGQLHDGQVRLCQVLDAEWVNSLWFIDPISNGIGLQSPWTCLSVESRISPATQPRKTSWMCCSRSRRSSRASIPMRKIRATACPPAPPWTTTSRYRGLSTTSKGQFKPTVRPMRSRSKHSPLVSRYVYRFICNTLCTFFAASLGLG